MMMMMILMADLTKAVTWYLLPFPSGWTTSSAEAEGTWYRLRVYWQNR